MGGSLSSVCKFQNVFCSNVVTNKKIPSSDCWLQFSFCGHIFFLYSQEHSVLMCLSKQLIKHMTFKSQQCMVFFI